MRLVALGILICAATSAQTSPEHVSFGQVVRYHLDRYPLMEIRDLYKLAFQAAMGSGHAVTDEAAVKDWLEREIATLGDFVGTPLEESISDPLSPAGELVRINLRPYVESGGDVDALAGAFVLTGSEFEESQDDLERYLGVLDAMAVEGAIPVETDRWRDFVAQMRAEGLPAVRHSTRYRDRYGPAYRVVLKRLLDHGRTNSR